MAALAMGRNSGRARSSAPRRTTLPPLRILVAGAVTLVVVTLVGWNALFASNSNELPSPAEQATDVGGAGVTSTTSTVVPLPIDPTWIRKGVSRYSESEKSKQVRDQLQPAVATTAPPTSSPLIGPPTSSRPTTTRAARPTTSAPITPSTTAVAIVPTTPVPTGPPPVTDPPTGT